MMEVISELRTDQAYLDRLGVQMVNPETGQEILVSDVGLRGVTFVDLQHPRRFGSVTLEYHVDTEAYSVVEWRGGEVVENGVDPFERQRVNFEDPKESLKWLAAFFQQRIDIPFGLNTAEYKSA